MKLTRGFIQFRRLVKENDLCKTMGETRWFFSAGREFGLWSLTIHGFGLYFCVIGPFRLELKRKALKRAMIQRITEVL